MYSTFTWPQCYIFSFHDDLMIISMPLYLAIFIWMKRAILFGACSKESRSQNRGNGVQKSPHQVIILLSPKS